MQKNATFPSRCIVRAALAVVSILSLPALGVTFDPPNPVEGSTVRIIGKVLACRGFGINVNVTEVDPLTKLEPTGGRRIEITEFDDGIVFSPPPCEGAANVVTVGPLRKGSYEVRHAVKSTDNVIIPDDVSPVQILDVGSAATSPPYSGGGVHIPDYTGFWMQAEGGSGISIQRDPGSGRMFAVWFTHTAPDWGLGNYFGFGTPFGPALPTALWMYAPNLQFGSTARVLTADLYVARNKGPGSPSQLQTYPPFPILTETRKVGTFRFEQKGFITITDRAVVTIQLAPDSTWQSTFGSLFPQSTGQELRVTLSRYRF